jgi:hypothetical protein
MADQINLSVGDLPGSIRKHLEFLSFINRERIFYLEDVVKYATQRYEMQWLPFYSMLIDTGESSHRLYPPFDVAWIWHCHLLSPKDYKNDCMTIIGKVLPHYCFSLNEIQAKQNYTRQLWEKNLTTPFDLDESSRVETGYAKKESRIKYDLVSSSERQKMFYYNVDLPHFRDLKFLELCIKRYKKFLYLKQQNPQLYIVPEYAIDIVWHTHQLYPFEYADDTKSVLATMLQHDDTSIDRSPGSLLTESFQKTSDLWRKFFNESYYFPGAMYRGEPPQFNPNLKRSAVDFALFYARNGTFSLDEARLTTGNDEKVNFKCNILRQNQKLYEFALNTKQSFKNERKTLHKFAQADPQSLDLSLKVAYKEKTGAKLSNLFKHGSTHDSSSDIFFSLKVQIPKSNSEYQDFNLVLNEPKTSNMYTLCMKWKLLSDLSKKLILTLKQDQFKIMHMNDSVDYLNDLKRLFQLENFNFNGVFGEFIRANHGIHFNLRYV